MYNRSQSSDNSMADAVKNAMEKGSDELGTISGGLEELFARGLSMECTFLYDDGTNSTDGVVYITGENMRGDFTTTIEDGTTTDHHMIRKGNTSYMWGSEIDGGIMMTIPDLETVDDEFVQSQQEDVFPVQYENVEYNCKPWIPNDALLTPPADVEFTDFSAQMEQMQELQDTINKNIESGDTEAVNEAACSACDQAPTEDSRTQCRTALGCN